MASIDNDLFIREVRRIIKSGQKGYTKKTKQIEFKKLCKKFSKTFLTPQEFRGLIQSDVDSVRFEGWMGLIRGFIKACGYIKISTGVSIVPLYEESSDYPHDYKLESLATCYWVKEGTEKECKHPKIVHKRELYYSRILSNPLKGNTVLIDDSEPIVEYAGSIWNFTPTEAWKTDLIELERFDRRFRETLLSLGKTSLITPILRTEK